MKRYYFAYGSNMNLRRMASRVPDAVAVATGRVDGWQVCERKYANLEHSAGSHADGVLFAIDDEGLAALDRFEGCPHVYRRAKVRVRTESGKYVTAVTYVMTLDALADRLGVPYPEAYRAICSAGARESGIEDVFALTPAALGWDDEMEDSE